MLSRKLLNCEFTVTAIGQKLSKESPLDTNNVSKRVSTNQQGKSDVENWSMI